MGESNQIKWRGIRPTNPVENIPVEMGAGETVEVVQDTAADLKATVTQAAKDRYPKKPATGIQVYGSHYSHNGTFVIYTTPSGKDAYVHTLHFGSLNLGGVAASCYMAFYNATPAIIWYPMRLTLPDDGLFALNMELTVPFKLIEDYSIRIVSPRASHYVWGSVMAWQE